MIAFDCPVPRKLDRDQLQWIFEDRYKLIVLNLPYDHSFIVSTPSCPCSHSMTMKQFTYNKWSDTKEDVKKFLEGALASGGEGLVLRKPKSIYHRGITDQLIKLKAYSCYISKMRLIIRFRRYVTMKAW